MGADRLGFPDARHRDGFLLGLLHAGLGWILVLGPGRECLTDTLARGHGTAAFCGRHGKERRAQDLDHLPRDSHLLAFAARHVPGPLGRAYLGALLRQWSITWPLH